jgi:hypothetical protein
MELQHKITLHNAKSFIPYAKCIQDNYKPHSTLMTLQNKHTLSTLLGEKKEKNSMV